MVKIKVKKRKHTGFWPTKGADIQTARELYEAIPKSHSVDVGVDAAATVQVAIRDACLLAEFREKYGQKEGNKIFEHAFRTISKRTISEQAAELFRALVSSVLGQVDSSKPNFS